MPYCIYYQSIATACRMQRTIIPQPIGIQIGFLCLLKALNPLDCVEVMIVLVFDYFAFYTPVCFWVLDFAKVCTYIARAAKLTIRLSSLGGSRHDPVVHIPWVIEIDCVRNNA